MSSELNDLDILREKRKENQNKKQNDWGSFLISILTGFIIIVIWAIIGSNLVYFVRYVGKGLNTFGDFFPDNAKDVPYFPSTGQAPPERGNLFSYLTTTLSEVQQNLKKGENSKTQIPKQQLPPKIPSFKRKPQQEIEMQELRKMKGGSINPKIAEMFDKITGLSKYSFPYNWKSSEEGLLGDFKAWIANSVEFSYLNGRSGINELLSVLHTVENGVGSWSIFLLSIPVLLLVLLLTQFYGFFSTLIGEIIAPNKGWVWAIIFFFVLGFDFILAFIVTILQTLQNLATFLFIPAFLDWSSISEILVEHTTLLTTIFGLYVISSAYANLDVLMGSTMLVTFFGLMIYNWRKNNKMNTTN